MRARLRALLPGAAALLLLLGAARAADLAGEVREARGTLTVKRVKGLTYDRADGEFPVRLLLIFQAAPPPVQDHGPGVLLFLDPDTGETLRTAPLGWRTGTSARFTLQLLSTSFGYAMEIYLGALTRSTVEVTLADVRSSGRLEAGDGPLSFAAKATGVVSINGAPDRKFLIKIRAEE